MRALFSFASFLKKTQLFIKVHHFFCIFCEAISLLLDRHPRWGPLGAAGGRWEALGGCWGPLRDTGGRAKFTCLLP